MKKKIVLTFVLLIMAIGAVSRVLVRRPRMQGQPTNYLQRTLPQTTK